MEAPKNYKDLTKRMLRVFNDVESDNMSIDKANTLVKASNNVINIQRTYILSKRLLGKNKMEFFQD